jgi:hypothetical protein
MGYSATAKALDKLSMIIEASGQNRLANTWRKDNGIKVFYEIGQEQSDGAVTGSVWVFTDESNRLAKKSGGFRIEPDGFVTRFPHLSKAMKSVSKQM